MWLISLATVPSPPTSTLPTGWPSNRRRCWLGGQDSLVSSPEGNQAEDSGKDLDNKPEKLYKISACLFIWESIYKQFCSSTIHKYCYIHTVFYCYNHLLNHLFQCLIKTIQILIYYSSLNIYRITQFIYLTWHGVAWSCVHQWNIAQWESALVVGGQENEHFSNYLTIWKYLCSVNISLKKIILKSVPVYTYKYA